MLLTVYLSIFVFFIFVRFLFIQLAFIVYVYLSSFWYFHFVSFVYIFFYLVLFSCLFTMICFILLFSCVFTLSALIHIPPPPPHTYRLLPLSFSHLPILSASSLFHPFLLFLPSLVPTACPPPPLPFPIPPPNKNHPFLKIIIMIKKK